MGRYRDTLGSKASSRHDRAGDPGPSWRVSLEAIKSEGALTACEAGMTWPLPVTAH